MNLQQNYNTKSIPGNKILEWLSLKEVKERFASTRRAERIFRNSPFDPNHVKSATGFGCWRRCWLGHNKLNAAAAEHIFARGLT